MHICCHDAVSAGSLPFAENSRMCACISFPSPIRRMRKRDGLKSPQNFFARDSLYSALVVYSPYTGKERGGGGLSSPRQQQTLCGDFQQWPCGRVFPGNARLEEIPTKKLIRIRAQQKEGSDHPPDARAVFQTHSRPGSIQDLRLIREFEKKWGRCVMPK